MKKLLGIVFLGLLLSVNAYASCSNSINASANKSGDKLTYSFSNNSDKGITITKFGPKSTSGKMMRKGPKLYIPAFAMPNFPLTQVIKDKTSTLLPGVNLDLNEAFFTDVKKTSGGSNFVFEGWFLTDINGARAVVCIIISIIIEAGTRGSLLKWTLNKSHSFLNKNSDTTLL